MNANLKNIDADDIINGLKLAKKVYDYAKKAYDEGKRIALAAGIPQEELDAALSRFERDYVAEVPTPPAKPLPPEPPMESGTFPYIVILDYDPREDGRLATGDALFMNAAGNMWWVLPHGVGMSVPDGFSKVWTKE